MKHVIVGTAGHIDHGKSALVRALTGTDPDRLEEEKRRGITIDIGFATLDLDHEYRLGFVDVPGHERFVKNMLAGITGIDLLLFVIAADQSIQPQTREHFDICRLLGVQKGIVLLTKADLVEPDIIGLVKLEVEEFVAGSFLEGAPILAVSAKTGQGLDTLKQELRRLAAEVPAKDSSRHFRLPIDRSFAMKGFGPVVTGTLMSGKVQKEAEIEAHPCSKRLRVRGIQVHGQPVDIAFAGQRTALNLAGVGAGLETGELVRGMTLTGPGLFHSTTRVDCLLELLNSAHPVKNGSQVHFHAATVEMVAKVVLLDPAATASSKVEPGTAAYVQFRLREPALLLPGDRFIIRQISPLITIGGGCVLDNWAGLTPAAVRLFSRAVYRAQREAFLKVLRTGTREQILEALLEASPSGSLAMNELIARMGWLESECREAASSLSKAGKASILSEEPFIMAHSEQLKRLSDAVTKALERFHKQNPLAPGLSKEALRAKVFPRAHPLLTESVLNGMDARKQITISGEAVKLGGHRIVLNDEEASAKRQITDAFERAGLATPSVKEVLGKLRLDQKRAEKLLAMLIQEKVLVRVSDELVFHTKAIGRLRQMLADYKTKNPRINVAGFKDLTQISRKYAIPLLEYLDRERVTRRAGDERILL